MQMLNCIFVLFTGPEEVLKFQGNDTVVDHFKLVLRDGNSLLVGARYVKMDYIFYRHRFYTDKFVLEIQRIFKN